ncbi:uncharacterized protein LOC111046786 isoform X2 [Nilaparvata lugens]|uniref:uncharacterized protein LOC111046786 isoform X2 n=1 Tax=Nilaparvata lugens TaxID=108931 RepID=UPI00193E67A7|nr:uncharacterized protein LOC111046786 isoform X2 [Nilaparvata lugens]XP_039296468.1 uncharacterized protein LOC111046786 isoform X2 [Nilaparvata lugens]
MATKERGKIALCSIFFFILLVRCTSAALVQRRILREISAETVAPVERITIMDGNTVLDLSPEETTTQEVTTPSTTTLKPYCSSSEPCGWAVYTKFTRLFEYYMANVCRCPSHKHCHRTREDLVNNAYVYTCIKEETDETDAWIHPPTPEPPTKP